MSKSCGPLFGESMFKDIENPFSIDILYNMEIIVPSLSILTHMSSIHKSQLHSGFKFIPYWLRLPYEADNNVSTNLK